MNQWGIVKGFGPARLIGGTSSFGSVLFGILPLLPCPVESLDIATKSSTVVDVLSRDMEPLRVESWVLSDNTSSASFSKSKNGTSWLSSESCCVVRVRWLNFVLLNAGVKRSSSEPCAKWQSAAARGHCPFCQAKHNAVLVKFGTLSSSEGECA